MGVMARDLDLRGSPRFHREVAEVPGPIGAGRVDVLAIVTARRPRPSVSPSTGTAA
jgi:L-idonate 5-dehydrogenase